MGTDFRILGELEVLVEGDSVSLGSPRQRALLARLLASRSQPISTDRLLEDLWRGEPPDNARHTLHVYISRLRKALGREGNRLTRQGSGYRLAVNADELDSARFEQLANDARLAAERNDTQTASQMFEQALDEWRGPAFGDFDDDTFAIDEAIRLEELRLATIEQRVWVQLQLGDHQRVAVELQDLVTHHPLRETLWEQLMLALYRNGRQTEALRVYQTAKTTLAREVGIEPGAALRSLEQRILAQDPALDLPIGETRSRGPVRLPMQRTSFVGRNEELLLAKRLLSDSRLVTLLGPPGSGKTRLALRMAEEMADHYPHGVFFVPLADIKEPALLGGSVAAIAEVADVAGETQLETLKKFFADRECLLVLDNFEHLLAASNEVGDILDAAPGVTILITSRAPLRISGEQRLPVPPMLVPPEAEDVDSSDLARWDSIALFAIRAKAADPAFEVDAQNAQALIDIVRMVDGLPLAIELAAARIALMEPFELRSRLQDRLSMLSEGPTDVTNRHRTMRDAIAWSYELLEPDQQRLFRRLGVFVSGFTLDAAEAIADIDSAGLLRSIESLLNQNLLHRPVTAGRARFAMLELTREYALDQLARTNELDDAERRHTEFFVDLATAIEPELTTDPGGSGAQRLEDEIANIRSALRFSLDRGIPDSGLVLASSVWRFWQSSERLTEGRRWLTELLEHDDESPDARAKGKDALAGLAYWQADYETARSLYREVLEYQRSTHDKAGAAETLFALSLTNGWLGEIEAARTYGRKSLELFELIGHQNGIGRAKCAIASTHWWENDHEKAYGLWMESVEIARSHNDKALLVTQLAGQAALTHHLGRHAEALEVAVSGLAEALNARNTHVAVWMLDLIAAFTSPFTPVEAVRLSGAVDRLRSESGGGVLPEYLQIVDARTTALDYESSETIASAWAQGHTMELDEAVDLANELGANTGLGATARERSASNPNQ